MDVIVLGAGIAGIATAYALNTAGLSVCVIEQHATVAQGASFGDGGLMLPSPLSAAFGPGAWPDVMTRPSGWSWSAKSRARHQQQQAERFSARYALARPLIDLSKATVAQIEARHGIDFEARDKVFYLFDSSAGFAAAKPLLTLLGETGHAHRVFEKDACLQAEPSLNTQRPPAAGVLSDTERSGNGAVLAKRLKPILQAAGVRFVRGRATALRADAHGVAVDVHETPADADAAGTASGFGSGLIGNAPRHAAGSTTVQASAVVVAAGTGSAALLAGAGIRLRLEQRALHALTAPIAHEECAPFGAIIDTGQHASIVRLDNRLRVFATAPLQARRGAADGKRERDRQRAFETLAHDAYDRLAGAARLSQARPWNGQRLATPDGLPVFGVTPQPRVFVNLGHGAGGWALSFGCAAALADIVQQHAPALDGSTLAASSMARLAAH